MLWCKKHTIYWIHVLIVIQAFEPSSSDQSTSKSTVRTTTSDMITPTEISTTGFPSLVIGKNCTNDSICIVNNSKCRENKCQCQDGFFELDNITCLPEVGLGSACSKPDACYDTNAVCNGTCVCQPGYYDDNGVNVSDEICTAKVGLGSNCSQPDACNDTNTVCIETCVCKPVYYSDHRVSVSDGIYTAKVGLGSTCSQTDACHDANAVCNGTCVCQPGYYVNVSDGICTAKIGLGSTCSQPDACYDTNAVCNGTCVCQPGYYDDNGVNVSDGICTAKVGLGSACSQPDACYDTNAVCNGTCVCQPGYYDDNGVNVSDGICTAKVGLGSKCSQPDACNDMNAVCIETCVCKPVYYSDHRVSVSDGIYTAKVGLGSTCSQTDACHDANAVCNGTCVCQPGYYVNVSDGICTAKIGLGSTCSQPDACYDTNAVCNGTCVCQPGYYDDNGVNVSDGICTAKVGLGSACSQPDACYDTNAVCNGTCVCQPGYYDDNGVNVSDGICTAKVGLGSKCSQPDACNDMNAVCIETCVCKPVYYSDHRVSVSDGIYTAKVGLGSTCSQTDACHDANAVCNGTCVCQPGYYVNVSDGICTAKIGLGSTCSQPDACHDTNAVCNGTCVCQPGYYDDNGVNVSDGICTAKVGLGSACSQPDACYDTNAVCNGTCVCQPGYYDDNGVNVSDGICTAKVGLGSKCSQPDACNDMNAVCIETCVCKPVYYRDHRVSVSDGIYTAKVGLGSTCSQTDACHDANAVCNGTCVCQPGYYVNVSDGICTAKVDLGSECAQPEACVTPHAECGISPENISAICVCREGYYDTNGTEISGECINVTILKVTSINYTTITEKTISMKWNASSSQNAVDYYIVEHSSSVSNTTSQTVGNNTSATIIDLYPGQRYSIKIKSVNTKTALSERSTYVEYYQISKPNTPGSLTEKNNIDASSGNITLTWTNPEGVETGYIGFLENTTLFEYNQSFSMSGTMLNQTFYGVKSGTWYNFTVQSISGYDDTETLFSEIHSEPIKTKVQDTWWQTILADVPAADTGVIRQMQTLILNDIIEVPEDSVQQVPDPPVDIRCLDRTDTYIKLMWNAPKNPNGDLRHFIINVNRTGPGPEIAYNVTTPTADTQYDVVNLTEGSFYTFQIYTVNEQYQSASASKEHYCETRANRNISRPVVQPEIRRLTSNRNQLVFYCDFDRLSDSSSLYQVTWYRDRPVTESKLMSSTYILYNSREQFRALTYLSEAQITLGMSILCTISATKLNITVPSEPYFAGFEMTSNNFLKLQYGEESLVYIRLTIPFGCQRQGEECFLGVNMFYIEAGADNCLLPVVAALSNCGVRISSWRWNQPYDLRLSLKHGQNLHSITRTYNIRFKTDEHFDHDFFRNYTLPRDIQVEETSDASSLNGKECHAICDPHMQTFDGRYYENQNKGTYILYKHLKIPIQVQMKTNPCYGFKDGPPFCPCGVAIAAGRDVFVVDRCSIPIKIYMPQCDEGILQGKIKSDGNFYQIHLPSGSWMKITSGISFNVYIYPSMSDRMATSGLCGYLDSEVQNDFMLRNGTIVTDYKFEDFNSNWLVKPDEDLFNNSNYLSLPRWPREDYFCICEEYQQGRVFQSDNCSPDSRKFCPENALNESLAADCNRKLSTDVNISIQLDHSDFNISQSRNDTQMTKRNFTEVGANYECWTYLNSSLLFKKCSEVPDIVPESFANTCTMDALIAKTMFWAPTHLDNAQKKCIYQVTVNQPLPNDIIKKYNVTLNPDENTSNKTTNKTGVYSPALLQELTDMACPMNCTDKGDCIKGQCLCYRGYGGYDCSVDLSKAPDVYGIPSRGVCDLHETSCDHVSILGDNFADSPNLSCRLSLFQVKGNERRFHYESSIILKAKWISFAEVSCPIVDVRSKRSVEFPDDLDTLAIGYSVAVGNNRDIFGRNISLLIVDSVCVDCIKAGFDIACTLKDGFDLINKRCTKKRSTEKETESEATVLIISTVSVSVLAVIVAGVILHYCFVIRRRRAKYEKERRETAYSELQKMEGQKENFSNIEEVYDEIRDLPGDYVTIQDTIPTVDESENHEESYEKLSNAEKNASEGYSYLNTLTTNECESKTRKHENIELRTSTG